MSWTTKVPSDIKLMAWQSLVYSKFSYGLALIGKFQPAIKTFHKKLLYQSFKALMGIKRNPETELLIQLMLGIEADQYVSGLANKVSDKVEGRQLNWENDDMLKKAKLHLNSIVSNNLNTIIQFCCGVLVSSTSKKHILKCDCDGLINDSHIRWCE